MVTFKRVSFIVFICLFTSVSYSEKPASRKTMWSPVDETDWTIYMSAPGYHFNCAKEYLKAGKNKKAAAEVARGEAFLKFQNKRISLALIQIEKLKKELSSGKSSDTVHFDEVIEQTMNSINRKYRMVPVGIAGSRLFGEAHEYHMQKAIESLKRQDQSVSADEIRQVSTFIKLKAASMGITPWAEVDSAATALNRLADRIEEGKVKNNKELDDVYIKVTSIFKKIKNEKNSSHISD